MTSTKRGLHKLFLLAGAVIILHGVALIMINDGQISFIALKFFTILSNLLVVVYFILRLALYDRKCVFLHYLSVSVLVSISVTGIVYNFLLVPFGGAPMIFSDYANFATHLFSMLLALVNYFAFENKGIFTFKHMLAGMVFPVTYWTVFISIGGVIDFRPYFFMNPEQIGWPMTFAWFGIILVIFALLGLGLVLFDKRKGTEGSVPQYKLEIYIPCSHLEALREALRSVGAGAMGNYDSVMSYSLVKGCWRPLPGANPFDGEIGVLTESDEYKVEVCCKAEALGKTIEAVKAAHPYEAPVINAIMINV